MRGHFLVEAEENCKEDQKADCTKIPNELIRITLAIHSSSARSTYQSHAKGKIPG
jgi:hypothetical protein